MRHQIISAVLLTATLTGCALEPERQEVASTTAPATSETPAVTAATETPAAPEATEAPPSTETVSQENARRSAEQYLSNLAFSRQGLIDQLLYEGFDEADATYGTDAVGADWNEQAAKSAAQYLDGQAFSRQGLIDQLIYEGFTEEQATYGVDQTGL